MTVRPRSSQRAICHDLRLCLNTSVPEVRPSHVIAIDGRETTTPPQFGPYNLDQEWIIEGRGVEPDIVVQNMPGDVLKGKDAQLEAAIANIQQRLAADPKEIPAVPAFLIKRK